MAKVVEVVRDPFRCFLVLALIVGGTLVFLIPSFGGIDERAHFYRSYQISTGRFLPVESPDPKSDFHGACIPVDVLRQAERAQAKVIQTNKPDHRQTSLESFKRCPGHPGERFSPSSTFGSPLPYLPQAATLGVMRALGADVHAMDLAGRIVVFLVSVALIGLAIRRTPRGRWAFAVVGLLPVTLFQATTITHDAMTTAISLLVVSSALRMLDPPRPRPVRAMLAEAASLTVLLALIKPTYIVLALLYLLPLLESRERRRELWRFGAVVGGGFVFSGIWNKLVASYWRTDADLFNIAVDSERQGRELLHRPWDFLELSLRSISRYMGDWFRALLNADVTNGRAFEVWPLLLLIVLGIVFFLAALQPDREELGSFNWAQRALLLVTFMLGTVLIFGANYVYYTAPGSDTIGALYGRYFPPLLVLLPLAVGSVRWSWARSRTAVMPIATIYVPFYVAFLVGLGEKMR